MGEKERWIMEYEKRTISSILEWKYSTHTLFMSAINEFKKHKDPKIIDLFQIVQKRSLDPTVKQDALNIMCFLSSIISINSIKNSKENFYETN